jgi:hypothetical protein
METSRAQQHMPSLANIREPSFREHVNDPEPPQINLIAPVEMTFD